MCGRKPRKAEGSGSPRGREEARAGAFRRLQTPERSHFCCVKPPVGVIVTAALGNQDTHQGVFSLPLDNGGGGQRRLQGDTHSKDLSLEPH